MPLLPPASPDVLFCGPVVSERTRPCPGPPQGYPGGHQLGGVVARRQRRRKALLSNRLEGKWIECLERVFALCKIARGDAIAILSETQSRQINVQLAELALHRIGARPFHLVVPTPQLETSIPIRS